MKKDVEEIITIIDEKTYQQFKRDICKTDDYFTIDEWKKLGEKLT